MREVVARAPTRIDLGGGWTDVPPYSDREGGFVCNIAITRHAVAHLTRTGNGSPPAVQRADVRLVRAAIKRAGVTDVEVQLRNDFPVGAGLGGSSAASAAVLGAMAAWRGETWTPKAIAEEGRRIEVEELGVAGGRQDHYAATHGGALALTFTNTVAVERIPLTAEIREEFVQRSILIYTGESRISGDTITAVLGAYEAGESRVLVALRRMRELAMDMATALRRGDLDSVGSAMHEHWRHQRALHQSIPTARIDDIIARAEQAGAVGAKAMGASGGGCVLILAKAGNVGSVRASIESLGEIIAFDIDDAGLDITRNSR
jgi:D-glycero-alpha-D-manno-heptose-7-phosphate kinase